MLLNRVIVCVGMINKKLVTSGRGLWSRKNSCTEVAVSRVSIWADRLVHHMWRKQTTLKSKRTNHHSLHGVAYPPTLSLMWKGCCFSQECLFCEDKLKQLCGRARIPYSIRQKPVPLSRFVGRDRHAVAAGATWGNAQLESFMFWFFFSSWKRGEGGEKRRRWCGEGKKKTVVLEQKAYSLESWHYLIENIQLFGEMSDN